MSSVALSGGDARIAALCQQLADARALGGTFVPWLAYEDGGSPLRRVNAGPWDLVDGTPVAESPRTCRRATLGSRTRSTRTRTAADYFVWTGTLQDGGVDVGSTCSDWTSSYGAGRTGLSKYVDSNWLTFGAVNCAASGVAMGVHLSCFEP